MFLLFCSDDTADLLYIGVIAGDTAMMVGNWMRDDNSIPDNITLSDIPTFRFSASPNLVTQEASWIRTRIFMDRTIVHTWSWGTSTSRMPPTPPHTTRYFQMAVYPSQTYICTGYRAHEGPILTPRGAAPDVNNNMDDNHQVLTALLNGHLLQLTQPEPLPRVFTQHKPTNGHKRRRPNGDI